MFVYLGINFFPTKEQFMVSVNRQLEQLQLQRKINHNNQAVRE